MSGNDLEYSKSKVTLTFEDEERLRREAYEDLLLNEKLGYLGPRPIRSDKAQALSAALDKIEKELVHEIPKPRSGSQNHDDGQS